MKDLEKNNTQASQQLSDYPFDPPELSISFDPVENKVEYSGFFKFDYKEMTELKMVIGEVIDENIGDLKENIIEIIADALFEEYNKKKYNDKKTRQ